MKTEFHFDNGEAHVVLTPENDYDWKLLDLAFTGATVKDIRRPIRDSENKESLTIVLTRESQGKPAAVVKAETNKPDTADHEANV